MVPVVDAYTNFLAIMSENEILFEQVLLVEDEPAHTQLIERALRGLIGSLKKCGTVGQAREQLTAGSFELIISDLNLPDLHSDEVVLSLRRVAPRTPMLVLTSSSNLSDAVSAMRSGANDFLVKKFDGHFSQALQLVLSRLRATVQAEQERARAARDRDLLQEAIENSNDGLAVAFFDGRIRYCNSGFNAFLRSFDVTTSNVFAIDPASVVRGKETLQKLREQLCNLEPGAVWTSEIVHSADSEVAFDISVSASRDKGNERVFVLWARDIRERKRRERFQREILSTTTHDLKGPLGAIAVSCDVLLDKSAEDAQAYALLERISTSASSAINLIEQFLSVRRMEEGAFVMRPIHDQLEAIVAKTVESFQLVAKTREVSLRLESEDAAMVGCFDPLGLDRVISNLISNAIKFSPKGGVVSIRLSRQAGGVVLSVQDCGSGMEPSEAQRLFHRYSRLPAHSGVAGSGLGLFIVKCIVNAHGGSIDVTSAVGKGTIFEVFLPDMPPCNERGEVLCLDFL